MTKKQAQKWLLNAGFQSAYSGHTSTLYVFGIGQSRLDHYGLPVNFKLEAQD